MIDPKDAAQLSAALQAAEQESGADRAAKQLISQIAAAKQEIGLEDSELFEAIAEGTSMKDPLYYTARIIQYLSEYLTPWAVPVVLGLGCWKAFELAQELVDLIGDFWKVNASTGLGGGTAEQIAAIKAKRKWKDGRGKAYFMEGMTGANVTGIMQQGLLAQLPPYASIIVSSLVARPAVVSQQQQQQQPPAAPAAPAKPPGTTGRLAPESGGYAAAPVQVNVNPWEQAGANLAYKAGEAALKNLGWLDAARDQARDGSPSGVAPTNLGLAQ